VAISGARVARCHPIVRRPESFPFAHSASFQSVRDNLDIWIAELSNIFNITPPAQSKAEIAA
jgi:hypothetical protein